MRIVKAADAGSIGSHFMAITDPGSKLEAFARESAFRNIFFGHAGIGGRFSALSDFGMIPAAVIGLNVEHLLAEADLMVRACGPEIAPARNPAVELGIVLARAALAGRDKITIAASGQIETFGSWLEQLLAESTGKDGKGVIPVDGEGLADPEEYSRDRLFVYLRLATAPDPDQDRKIAALEEAGHAVVRIDVATPESLAGELFRWELATAVAGVELGLNPFDQPDVEASKVATRELTTRYEASGVLPVSTPVFEWGAIAIFGGGPGARAASSGPAGLMDLFRTHLDQIRPGDYFAVLAYVERNTVTGDLLDRIRRAVRGRYRVATPVGFGPRFLHSSGQLYKGGPNSGVFLQITCDDSEDLPVPGRRYTFGVVKTAQAAGDLSVLDQRGRRWLRVHIRQDLLEGLEAVAETIEMALESSGG
jgi:transaldolase/glucose-6-phosphate isomerase